MELGKYNTLEILRDTSVGLYLGDDKGNDVLLPNKYVPKSYEIGDMLTVFCYLDYDERPVATTLKPHIKVGEFKLLKVVEVNKIGAFLDWGLEKHLLVPFREQRNKMVASQWYIVFCYLDEQTDRLVASNKLDDFIENDKLEVTNKEEVDLIFARKTDLGWEVIINNWHKGLVYANEVYQKISIGDEMVGYIKNIRADNKIDVSLQPIGHLSLEPTADLIYQTLVDEKGFIGLHDKSDPEDIKDKFKMSKKAFKKAIGTLYRERRIEIKSDGIYLL